ncbi:hypothetical protein RYX36_029846, partial [Vicia faba]
DVGNYATDKDDVIKKGDYVEVEDFPFANIMKRIMENLTKYNDNGKQEKDHVVINVGDNIDYVVNDSINIDEGFIPMSDEVHDGTEPINEGVTKDVDLCKRTFEIKVPHQIGLLEQRFIAKYPTNNQNIDMVLLYQKTRHLYKLEIVMTFISLACAIKVSRFSLNVLIVSPPS